MLYKGSCKCNRWRVEVKITEPLDSFAPRICDCSYCQDNPSRIISDPKMAIEFIGEGVSIRKNGDQIANFYHCNDCGILLAAGCRLDGQLRGAVNSNLLHDSNQLGEPIQIQPRLLSTDEKLERWNKLWGVLNGL